MFSLSNLKPTQLNFQPKPLKLLPDLANTMPLHLHQSKKPRILRPQRAQARYYLNIRFHKRRCAILRLPYELLLAIILHIDNPSTLIALSRTNHRLLAFIQDEHVQRAYAANWFAQKCVGDAKMVNYIVHRARLCPKGYLSYSKRLGMRGDHWHQRLQDALPAWSEKRMERCCDRLLGAKSKRGCIWGLEEVVLGWDLYKACLEWTQWQSEVFSGRRRHAYWPFTNHSLGLSSYGSSLDTVERQRRERDLFFLSWADRMPYEETPTPDIPMLFQAGHGRPPIDLYIFDKASSSYISKETGYSCQVNLPPHPLGINIGSGLLDLSSNGITDSDVLGYTRIEG
ncbi:hypothetical protein BJ508DRAFT_302548 [Ascobolus immersus RN42]|uniref:F-box domain-containing protein n=1 Tax=Ascobolus immersus RN42 TaxID=1160509 RepID=A0A3N4INE6_ASCIM|nr:hypothetical protein BJ508DRAFT_302548 [Ascobolus immersus RN42]